MKADAWKGATLLAVTASLVSVSAWAQERLPAGAGRVDSGDTAWILAASALVVAMIVPGLALFYGGMVRSKNVLGTMMHSFLILCVVSIVWVLWGYSLAFAPDQGGVIGALDWALLSGVGAVPHPVYAPTVPHLAFAIFQLMFAAFTPALIAGAFAERIRFSALLGFTIAWSLFVYAPLAHWMWGGGWLSKLGAVDFAGGTVVHICAGASALACALVLGRRRGWRTEYMAPHNLPLVLAGTGLLWFGWFGFNGGSALAANGLAANALVVTNLAAAAAGLSWMGVDWIRKGKPSAVGFAIGVICGLVAITPASGFVSAIPSIIIGLVAGIISNIVANIRVTRTKIDDTLDVFACHGIAGMWGALATGLFASAAINNIDGLFYGNPLQLWYQAIAVAAVIAYTFIGSYVLLKLISLFKSIRVSKEDEEKGLDISQHKEEAYG